MPSSKKWLLRSRIRQAQYRYQGALRLQERRARSVERQTRAAYFGIDGAIHRAAAFGQSVAAQELALQARRDGYESGLFSSVEVLDGVRQLFVARRDYARARYDYLVNSLLLRQAAGVLAESDLAQLNQWLAP